MNTLVKPLDFSKYTFRASSNGKLCGKSKAKTPIEKYNDCVASIEDLEKKCNEAKNKETKSYMTNYTKLVEKKDLLKYLEKHKNDKILSQTAIKYLVDIYAEARYGVRKNIFGKYLSSGTAREADSIKLIRLYDDELYRSYKEYCEEKGIKYRQFNDYVEGECDVLYPVVEPEEVQDVKSCWDVFTFQPHTLELSENDGEDDIENIIYKYQGVSYCVLYNVKKFKLRYCLVDMPDELIEDEIKRIVYQFGKKKEDTPECQSAITEFVRKCKFDHIPIEARVITFEYDYNEEDYNFLIGQIETAREWLNNYSIKEWERETGKKWIINGNTEENLKEQKVEDKWIGLTESPHSKCPKCNSDHYHAYGEFGDMVCDECVYDTADEETPNIQNLSNIFKPTSEHIEDIQAALKQDEEKTKDELLGLSTECACCEQPVTTDENGIYSCGMCNYTNDNDMQDKKENPVISNSVEEVSTLVEAHIGTEIDPILIKINKCTSREDVVELYSDQGAQFWQDNKFYMDKLTEKRNSFKIEPAKNAPKTTETANTPPPAQPIKQKPIFKIPSNNPEEGDKEKIEEFKKLYPTFTTMQQYANLYIENRTIIDRNLDFRSEYDSAGKAYALKLAQQKREELQKSVTGG